jgi:hypothetical protein
MPAFYWSWIKLARGAAAWTRAVVGTLTIFLPLLSWIPTTQWFMENAPGAIAWIHKQPIWIPWLPLILFAGLFIARFGLAPYWLYRDKPKPPSLISQEQAERLATLWRTGSRLYEKRVSSNSLLVVWQHEVQEWASDVYLLLYAIDPGEAFSFESIGFQHRQSQNLNEDAQYSATRLQLGERLGKLRLVTGRHLQVTAE